MLFRSAAAAFLMFFATSGIAQNPNQFDLFPINDGNDLLRACEANNYHQKFLCMQVIDAAHVGFINGVHATEFEYKEILKSKWKQVPRLFCLPERLTMEQSKDVVVEYLMKNPKYRHLTIGFVVSQAFSGAFPCS